MTTSEMKQATETAPETARAAPTVREQAAALLGQVAGYVGHRTVAMGLRQGIIPLLAEHPEGLTPDEIAAELGNDPFYVGVWARAARAAGYCEAVEDDRIRLAPHVDTLLLDTASPAYVGGIFTTLEQYEIFSRFEEHLSDGERLWWDACGPEFIASVSTTGVPFYVRLIPGGLAQVPGLAEVLTHPVRILDTACGAGSGVVRLAQTYPAVTVVGADGDAHSLSLARERVEAAGLGDRVQLIHSPLEELHLDGGFALVVNNISMHECRDIDRVTDNVRRALDPGGWFVVSDFPFPETEEGLRTVPGRIMSGIQFFEAQIDDQLLPRSAYDDLLRRHGFRDLGHVELSPVHAITYGRK